LWLIGTKSECQKDDFRPNLPTYLCRYGSLSVKMPINESCIKKAFAKDIFWKKWHCHKKYFI
jgi:hypothetical protein